MSVSNTTSKAGPYSCNGAQVTFAFAFKAFSKNDLRVVLTNAQAIESDLTVDSQFTVTLNADQNASPGGTITTIAIYATGNKITVVSNQTANQLVSITNFRPDVIEKAFDKLTILIQQMLNNMGRTLSLPISAPSGISTQLPLPSPNKVIAWDANGTALQSLDPTALASIVAFGTAKADIFSGDGATKVFTLSANPGALANLDVSVGGVCLKPGDDYTWSSGTTITFTNAPANASRNILIRYLQGLPQGYTDAGSVSYADGSTYGTATVGYRLQQILSSIGSTLVGYLQSGTGAASRTVQDRLREDISVKDFGAKGDGVTDDTTALQNAINAVQAANGGTIFFPAGIYQISSPLSITSGQVSLIGQSVAWFGQPGGSTIRQATANTDIIRITGASSAAQINSNTVANLLLVHGTNSGDDTNTGGIGIKLANTVRTTIDNCVIIGMQIGIDCNFVIDLVCTRTKIHRVFSTPAGSTYGVFLHDDGTHFNASCTWRDMIISGSPTRTGTFTGVYYSGAGLNDQFFENCEVDFCEYGFSLSVSAPTVQYDVKVNKCAIDNYTVKGIYLSGFTNSGGVDIIGGWIAPAAGLTSAAYGIHCASSAGVKIIGAELVGVSNVTNTNAIGIYLNTCTDCQIVGNRIRDYYIHIGSDTLTDSVIVGNSFKQSSATAAGTLLSLNTSSSRNTIIGNTLNAATSAGRGVHFASGGSNQLRGNVIDGTYTVAQVTDTARATAIANALNSNLSLTPNADYVEFTGGGASAQLGGIVAGYDGQEITILNTTGSGISIIGESASSTAANRIYTPGLATVTWSNLGSRSFKYSATQARWLLMGAAAA